MCWLLCCTRNGTGVVVGYEGKGRRSQAGLWICWAQEERKKERKKENWGLGMLSTSSYTQKTGVWVLFIFFGPPAFLWWCFWLLPIGWGDVLELWRLKRWASFCDPVFFVAWTSIWRFFAIPKCMCFCFVVWWSLFASFFGVWMSSFFFFLFLRFPLVMLWQLQIGWDDVLELWGLKRGGSFNDPVFFFFSWHELLIWSVFYYPYMSVFLHYSLVVSFGCFSKL